MKKRFKSVDVVCPLTGHSVAVSPRWASRITGRSLRTAQRWANGSRMDKAARELLALRVFGVLPGAAWKAFRLRGDCLENIETGETWTPNQLRGAWVAFQQLQDTRRTATKKPALVAGLHVSPFQAG